MLPGYPAAVRRLGLVVLAALAVAAPANAATLNVSARAFSPAKSVLLVSAKLSVKRQVGISLARPSGHVLGWVVRPSRRTTLSFGWDGRIDGKRVPDGRYVARLVYRSTILATAPLRIDGTAPELASLRVDNGATPFSGDNAL